MRKVQTLPIVLIIILIALSVFVYAAGTSTGGNNNRNNQINATNVTDDNRTQGKNNYTYQERNCEEFENRLERIRCKLIQGEEEAPDRENVEESCRNLGIDTKTKCIAFYATVRTCYSLEGRAKDACFKRASGLKERLSEEPREGRPEKVKMYMIAVLYNLQEKVEKWHERDRLSDNDAAELVNKIVETKQAILDGATKAEIRQMVQELKQMWRDKISTQGVESE